MVVSDGRGKVKPSRKFVIETPNVKKIRTGYKLSQNEFAALMGISVKTLDNWEQGRRAPEGPRESFCRSPQNTRK